jgi:hypothetical protein
MACSSIPVPARGIDAVDACRADDPRERSHRASDAERYQFNLARRDADRGRRVAISSHREDLIAQPVMLQHRMKPDAAQDQPKEAHAHQAQISAKDKLEDRLGPEADRLRPAQGTSSHARTRGRLT